MASPRTRPSSELVDDIIIDVLLHLPPEDPAHLVRASLVCKQWRRVVSHPDFLRFYARVHGTPPLLGFFTDGPPIPCFVPTTAAAAAAGEAALAFDNCSWLVLDCRHVADDDGACFLVWDPITGDRHELPWLNNVSKRRSAVVLCAAAADGEGCDHSGRCRGGPFLVLCADVGIHGTAGWHARARVYSSQLRAWGAPLHLDLPRGFEHLEQSRAVVIGVQIYLFRLFLCDRILKYDLRRHCLAAIDSPGFFGSDFDVELMTTEEGLLGLACARLSSRIHLWTRTANAGWEQSRVIDLRRMISSPAGAGIDDDNSIINRANVIGFAEGANAILVTTNVGTFVVDLKSGRARKICNSWIHNPVVPFMTF